MTTAMQWPMAVALVVTLAVGGAAAWAADNAIILQNNQKAIIDGNKLFLVGRDGKRTPAKDGTYQVKNGGSIILQHGIILQNPGEAGGIILQQPGGQKGAPAAK